MRQIGKKQKGVLLKFLDKNLEIIPVSVLKLGLARVQNKDKQKYITRKKLMKQKINFEKIKKSIKRK